MKLLLASILISSCGAFAPASRSTAISNGKIDHPITSLQMAGMGMGGGATKSKKKKGGKAKSKGMSGGGGSATKSFDVAKSLLKAEKLYDELAKDSAKVAQDDDFEYLHAEYMVAARISPKAMKESAGNIPGAASVSDWVPVAQLCLKRHVDDPNFDSHVRDCARLQTAVSYYCREISYAATLGASIFKSIPRNAIEYSIEPIDSFHKFVYEDIIEGKNENDKNENTMTKIVARSILELEEGCNDASDIKSAYRKLSFKLHPDRFVSKGRSEEEINQASADFAKVKVAYDSLSSGVRETDGGRNRSWYESLGGRSRTDFSGKLNLLPMADARSKFEKEDYKSAIACLNTDTVMTFVTRNQAAAASANSGGD